MHSKFAFLFSFVRLGFRFISLIVFCEYLIYYIILGQCSWPTIKDEANNNREGLKVALIADTHLLGIRKGHWFDKLRREWQMFRSFQTLMTLHEPEIVFILGDIFDEASFSPDDVYAVYVKRFFELFYVNNKTEMFVVAGNHDIGFHYAMHPYLEYRFMKTLNASSVRLLTRKNVHFVLINSMALERDGCQICRKAEKDINLISDKFHCTSGVEECYKDMKLRSRNRPILLQHFPLYRKNDEKCNEPTSASFKEKRIPFKEKWDCLSKDATEYVLNKLNPRAIFTGHTHYGCHTVHRKEIHEFTIPSFNWRNIPNPSFIMAAFTEDQYAIYSCHLPHEYFVIFIYVSFTATYIWKLVNNVLK